MPELTLEDWEAMMQRQIEELPAMGLGHATRREVEKAAHEVVMPDWRTAEGFRVFAQRLVGRLLENEVERRALERGETIVVFVLMWLPDGRIGKRPVLRVRSVNDGQSPEITEMHYDPVTGRTV